MWNDLPYTVFDTGTLDGFKGGVNRWWLPLVCCSVFHGDVLVGLRKQFIKKIQLGPVLLILIIIIIIIIDNLLTKSRNLPRNN